MSAAGERFVIYEQNEQPFEERGKFAVGGTAYLCWSPRHTVLIRQEPAETLSAAAASPLPPQAGAAPDA